MFFNTLASRRSELFLPASNSTVKAVKNRLKNKLFVLFFSGFLVGRLDAVSKQNFYNILQCLTTCVANIQNYPLKQYFYNILQCLTTCVANIQYSTTHWYFILVSGCITYYCNVPLFTNLKTNTVLFVCSYYSILYVLWYPCSKYF